MKRGVDIYPLRIELAMWLKYRYWTLLRFLPFGATIWFWADDTVDRYCDERDGVK